MDYVAETKGYIKAYFSDQKVIMAESDFFEQLTPAAPIQRYQFKVSDILPDTNAILLHIAGIESDGFKGEFYVKGSKVERKFESFNSKDFFVRIYLKGAESELTDDLLIETNVEDTVMVGIKAYAIPRVFPLEDDQLVYYGDYLAPDALNCYSSTRYANGANLVLETDMTDVKIFVNPLTFPERIEDFAYSYTRDEVTVNPAEIGTSTITIPVNAADLVYVCVTSKKPVAYSLDSTELDPLILRRGQNVKLYLKNDFVTKALYAEIVKTKTPMKVTFEAIKGCSKVMLKLRRSYYYNYLMIDNETKGISPFDSEADSDTIMFQLAKTGESVAKTLEYPREDTRCTGSDVYTECPTLFYTQSCDKESVILIKLEGNDDPNYILHTAEFANLRPGQEKTFLFPDVPPQVDLVKIFLNTKKAFKGIKKGLLIAKQEKGKEQTREIMSETGTITLTFNNKEDNFRGNYYITIKSFQEFNFRLMVKMYSTINNAEQEVQNIRGGSTGNVMLMNIVNSTYQVGYFTFYGKADPGTVAAILPNPSTTLEEVVMHASAETWPADGKGQWSGKYLRLPRENRFYYIFIEGIPSPDDTSNGEIEGLLFPGILESQRNHKLQLNVNYTFDGQRLFKFQVEKNQGYLIRKVSSTVESIFLSVDPRIQIPLNDSYTHMVGPVDPEELEAPAERVLAVPKEDLKETSEVTFTVYCHWLRCRYSLWIEKAGSASRADL